MTQGLTYREAGVNLDVARVAKARFARFVTDTRTDAVVSDYGSFGGRFRAGSGKDLVASVDGVGTKLKVAFAANRHDTVGMDLVNHLVNDILVEGAEPLVFLDYFACGTLDPDTAADVVAGAANACRDNGCALLGGETAEMPGFYAPGEYDLAGFVVGHVSFPRLVRRELQPGYRLVGLAANGIHTNGYSFVRELFFARLGMSHDDRFPGSSQTVADILLEPHPTYLPALRESLEGERVAALAHITGGGIPGNLNRVLGDALDAVVRVEAWDRPHIFQVIARESGADEKELFDVFNMGVGMVAIVPEADSDSVISSVQRAGVTAFECGELVPGEGIVRMVGL